MELTIVIVNYRVKYFLEQTLRAAVEATRGVESEIIVIDNASGDDSAAHSRERFPQVKFVENTENVGFGRANNQGIAMAQGRYTLLLNPDTIITRASVEQCIAHMESHSDCGATGVRMVDGNGVFLPESKRSFPSPWVSFCKVFGLTWLFPKSRVFGRYHLRYLSELEAHEVDILSGAFMLCRTKLLQDLGGFDEDFFMYGEDIDLSYRMTLAGYKNQYLPASIIHYKGESTKKDSIEYVRVFYEAMLIFYRKHFPRYSAVMYPLVKTGVLLRASLAALKRLVMRVPVTTKVRQPEEAWVVLSSDPAEAARAAGLLEYGTEVPEKGKAQVIIDDGDRSYEEIVEYIATHSRKGLAFHIYSRRNGIVISPKM